MNKFPCPFCGSTDGATLYDCQDYVSVCCAKCDASLGQIAGPGTRAAKGALWGAMKKRQDDKAAELAAVLRGER